MDTKNTLIAERYSDALVQIAKDGRLSYEKINADLEIVNNILAQSKDLMEFLTNPTISAEDKKGIIGKVFSEEIDTLIVNFLKVLVDKNRFSVFEEVLKSYKKTLDDVNNISRVQVTSAVEMNEESKVKLREKLEQKMRKNVVLELNISPDIIAGLILKMGDNVIDMSLRHKLEDLSKNIIR
ncbi:MAG: ATP synthase F1 subunit delta [Candidatus Gastranaerophilaceae bacterium]